MTNLTRPGASSSTVWIAPARTEASRVNGLVTAGNSVSREVLAAAWPRTTKVSREIIWLSRMPAPSKPAASTSWIRRISLGIGAVPGMQRETRMGSLMVFTPSGGDGRRAVALVHVAERRTAGCGAGTVVAQHLQLGVAAIGGAHCPHPRLGAQDVREEAVGVPRGDGRVARIGAALVGQVAGGGHRAHVVETDLAQIEDARPGPGDDRVAAEGQVPALG